MRRESCQMPSDEHESDMQKQVQWPLDLSLSMDGLFGKGQLPKLATVSANLFFEYHVTTLKLLASGRLELDLLTATIEPFKLILENLASLLTTLISTEQALEKPVADLRGSVRMAFETLDNRVSKLTDVRGDLAVTKVEIALCRSVDNYLIYISNVIAEIYRSNPRMLKSSEQVTFEDVLQHGSLDEFVDWAIERRISTLSFKGFNEISKYVNEKLGLSLVQNSEMRSSIAHLIAVRNLLIHKRGVIDGAFLRASMEVEQKKGRRYFTTGKDIEGALNSTYEAVCDLDGRARAKFSLSTIETRPDEWWKPFDIGIH